MFKRFNDVLAMVYVVGLLVIILAESKTMLYIAPETKAVLLTILTLVFQFYFRRAGSSDAEK